MNKICQCKKSRSSLFILSKREDDLIVECKMYSSSFDRFADIITCSEDILWSLLDPEK